MNNVVLKSNTNLSIGNEPMVLLPLALYEKFANNIKKSSSKKGKNILATLSESSLSKDWLLPEEEKVWENL